MYYLHQQNCEDPRSPGKPAVLCNVFLALEKFTYSSKGKEGEWVTACQAHAWLFHFSASSVRPSMLWCHVPEPSSTVVLLSAMRFPHEFSCHNSRFTLNPTESSLWWRYWSFCVFCMPNIRIMWNYNGIICWKSSCWEHNQDKDYPVSTDCACCTPC